MPQKVRGAALILAAGSKCRPTDRPDSENRPEKALLIDPSVHAEKFSC